MRSRRAAAVRRRAPTGGARDDPRARPGRARGRARRRRPSCPRSAAAASTFSSAVSIGSRLKNWKTKPMCARRSFVSSVSDIVVMSWPAISTVPSVGWSRPASMCISVDLPEPEGPMTATAHPLRRRARRRAGRRRPCRPSRSGGRGRARRRSAVQPVVQDAIVGQFDAACSFGRTAYIECLLSGLGGRCCTAPSSRAGARHRPEARFRVIREDDFGLRCCG